MINAYGRRFLRLTVVACLILSGLTVAPAQETGKIAGKVRDKATGEGLIGANIVIKGTHQGAASDINGDYFILNVLPGDYTITATFLGYRATTTSNVIVNTNRTTTIDIDLQEQTVDIGQEVVVVAERPEIQREKTSTSEIVRATEVLAVPGIRDIASVLSLSSDISDSHFRGGRVGEELYTLQGMGIIDPLSNASSFAPIMSALEEVEIITSGFSAQYGNAQSGVVNISMKEGRSDKWSARVEGRMRAPSRKHFGPSVWDVNANPYLRRLISPQLWSENDTSGDGTGKYYNSIGNGFNGRYGKDSVTLGQVAYTYWALQAKRDLGKSYDDLVDHSLNATIGGPLSEGARIFLAFNSENEWPVLPTPEPDQKRQFMGNIVFDMEQGMTLRLSGAYTNERETIFRSVATTGFYSWIWDRVLATTRGVRDNTQIGARFTYASSNSTFYEVKVNTLGNTRFTGSPVIDQSVYNGDFSKIMWVYYGSTPDGFTFGNIDDDFRTERSRTVSIDASMTSQVTNAHMILAGLQANAYVLDVNNTFSLKSSNGQRYEIYTARPFEFAAYVQDKMEFEGMIANLGLRFDVYDQNVAYYTDQFTPYRYISPDGDTLSNSDLASKSETPTLSRLQPRLGISFPVSESMVFHVNYGTFIQRPPFSQTVYQQEGANLILGNPRLKPQITNSYDIGLTQGLGSGFRIDVSGYYKDVRDLIQQAFFYDRELFGYSTFVNRDYADIRGFRIGFGRSQGMFRGTVNYTYGVATGKNSTPFNESPKFYEDGGAVLPTAKDILLDFDRTHNVVASVVFQTGGQWGPVFMDIAPFENVTVSATAFVRSGQPYTYDTQGLGELFNKRSPLEKNTNVKITKDLPRFFGARMSMYLEIFNLFDDKIYNYNAIFRKTRDGSSGTMTDNPNLKVFETNRASLHLFEDPDYPGYIVNQTFMLYSNSPRSFQFGLVINL